MFNNRRYKEERRWSGFRMNNSSILPIPYEFSLFRHTFSSRQNIRGKKNPKYLFADLRKNCCLQSSYSSGKFKNKSRKTKL